MKGKGKIAKGAPVPGGGENNNHCNDGQDGNCGNGSNDGNDESLMMTKGGSGTRRRWVVIAIIAMMANDYLIEAGSRN